MINIKLYRYLLFILCSIFIICYGVAFGQNIEFFGCEGVPWVRDSLVTHDGDTSLRSGPIECSGSSILCGHVKGPVDISFWWKNGAYPKIGQLLFEINGTKVVECDSREWKRFSYPLSGSNVYTLKWTFRRISSYPKWEGSAWLAGIDSSGLPTISSLNSKKSSSSSGQGTIGSATINGAKSNLSQNFSADETGASYLAGDKAMILQNITVIPNITIMPIPSINNREKEKGKSPLIVKLLEPGDESFFDLLMPIKFKFKAIFNEEIPICTWFIDDAEINKSRTIYDSGSTAFNHTFAEPGMHSWNVNCCDCMERCNSSEEIFFYIRPYNNTTYVNKLHPDTSRFKYSNLKQAVENLSPGGVVIVENGSYEGSIEINKPLKLKGNDSPVIDLLGKEEFGVVIKSDQVEISGFVIKNSLIGIQADGRKDADGQLQEINISGNKVLNCMVGISLINCNNASLISNTLDDFRHIDIENKINGKYYDLNALHFENVSNFVVLNNTVNKINNNSVIIENCLSMNKITNIVLKKNKFYNSTFISNYKFIDQSFLVDNDNELCNIKNIISEDD